jgi:alpha-tubulin suppressor-like RCC1 family protein
MKRYIATVLIALIGLLTMTQVAGASSPTIYQWGQVVAPGSPGNIPTPVQSFAATQIDSGNTANLAVLPDGAAQIWGGQPLTTATMTASQVPNVSDLVQRPVDGNHSFDFLEQPGSDPACPDSTTVVKWAPGHNDVPEVVTTLNCQDVVQLAAGASHTFALTATGQVYAWGDGNLGLGPNIKAEKNPTLNTYLTSLTGGTSSGVEITAGSTTGGILINGQAYAWGFNAQDQCGCNSTASQIFTPIKVDQGSLSFKWIDQGGNLDNNGHTLAIDTNGNIWAWGANSSGQLGNGNTINQNQPVQVLGLPSNIVDVRAGGAHSLALDANGNVWAWGSNSNGQVGNNSKKKQLLPVEVLSDVTMISAGALQSLAE